MNKNYNYIFRESADSWEKVTPSIVEVMFERAENRNLNLKSFKNWLMRQPLTPYTKSRVEDIYNGFIE